MKIEKLTGEYLDVVLNSCEGRNLDIYYCIKNLSEKLNEMIKIINEIRREDQDTVVSMIAHKGEAIMATKYKVFKLINNEFIELKFTSEE